MPLSLLLPGRRTVDLKTSDLIYDPQRQLNMVSVNGELRLAIDQPMRIATNSKTRQAPGDDDPDDGGERLY
jgi:hypothetical protein